MIKIQSYNQNSSSQSIANIYKLNSILIIGRADNSYKLGDFTHPKNYDEVVNLYGISDLSMAYLEAIESGAKNVFLMNCYKITDFVDSIEYVKQYNFAYIVPVGLKLSDTFYSEKYNKKMHYAEFYLKEFSYLTNSTIIFTDSHAKLYENIDAYIYDMKNRVISYKMSSTYTIEEKGSNFLFVLNMLKNRDYANVVLASKLSITPPGEYPVDIHEPTVFSMHKADIPESEIIYYQENINIGTTIENLNNFRVQFDCIKIVTINSIIKYIERNLDLSFAIGKLYTAYLRINLSDYIDMFFRRELTTVLKEYSLGEITFVPLKDMTGYIEIPIKIWPINSLEYIDVALEVK